MPEVSLFELAATAARLDPHTFQVWAIVRSEIDDNREWSGLQASIASKLNTSLRTVQRAFRELKQAGLLHVVKETHRSSVYRLEAVATPDQEPPDFQLATNTRGTSENTCYVKLVTSSLTHPPNTSHPPALSRQNGTISPHFSQNLARSESKPKPKEKTTTAPIACISGNGGGVVSHVDNSEGFVLLAGLKSLKRRRELAANNSPEVIKTAISMARKVPNARDVVAMASSFLVDGSAALEANQNRARHAKLKAAEAQTASTQAHKQDAMKNEAEQWASVLIQIRRLSKEEICKLVDQAQNKLEPREHTIFVRFREKNHDNTPETLERLLSHPLMREYVTEIVSNELAVNNTKK